MSRPRKRALEPATDWNSRDRALSVREPPSQRRKLDKSGRSSLIGRALGVLGNLMSSLTSNAAPTPLPSSSWIATSSTHDVYSEPPPLSRSLSTDAPEMREVSRMEAYAAANRSGPIVVSRTPRAIPQPRPPSSLRSLPSAKPSPAGPIASTSRLPPASSTSRLPSAPSSACSGVLRRRGSEGSMRDALAAPRSSRARLLQRQREEDAKRLVDQCASEYGTAAASRPRPIDVDPLGKAQFRLRLDKARLKEGSSPREKARMQQALENAKQTTVEDLLKKARLSELSEHAQRAAQRQSDIDAELDAPAGLKRQWRATLDPEDELYVQDIMRNNSFKKSIPGAEVQAKDIRKLRPGQWLNDEVINFYAVMLNNRCKEYEMEYEKMCKAAPANDPPPRELLRTHVFSSFFYSTFKTQGYAKVARWTKKMDLFKLDYVIVPVNFDNAHWVCSAINMRKKRFEFFDSMGSFSETVIGKLREYLEAEHLDKKKTPIDLSDWEDYERSDVPQQENGFDCGVFTSQVMECLTRPDAPLDYAQSNMTYLRKKMVLEIARNQLLDEFL